MEVLEQMIFCPTSLEVDCLAGWVEVEERPVKGVKTLYTPLSKSH